MTAAEANTSRLVTLIVSTEPGVLAVSPAERLESGGFLGGPFSPDVHIYTLSNSGGEIFPWNVETDVDWLEFSASGGELSVGESVEVTATIMQHAEYLPAGEYPATITFRNPVVADSESIHELHLTVYRHATLSAAGSDPANGGFTIHLTGEPGLTYRIEASEDFKVWIAVHTGIVPAEGVIEFTDSQAPDLAHRFYRAVFE